MGFGVGRFVAVLALAASLSACTFSAYKADASRVWIIAAPTSASSDVYCANYADVLRGASGEEPDAGAIKDFADQLAEVGTPENISEEAREGFEIFIDTINDLPDDASAAEIEDFDPDISDEDDAKVDAFFEYTATECAEALGIPSDLPSAELPDDSSSESTE